MKTSTGFLVTLLVCALASMGVLGCNTFRGAGKDIQKGGEAVERAANDVQNDMKGPHTITAWAETGGLISPSGHISVANHSSRSYTIKANWGYHVSDVLVDGQSVGAVNRYTFDSVTANHTIMATFTRNANQ